MTENGFIYVIIQILSIIFTVGSVALIWLLILPTIKEFIEKRQKFNKDYNKWKNHKDKNY